MAVLKKIPTWFTGSFIFMSLLYLLWFYVIIPIETLITPTFPLLASFLYLPHFVRVIATWYYGHKAFFGLVAGHSLGFLITMGNPPFELSEMGIIVLGSGSAAVALWLLDWAKLLKPAENTDKAVNWRGLVFLGFLASLINAIGSVLIRLDGAPAEEMLPFILRILIGDTGSIIIGLMVMMFSFRILRGLREQKEK